METQKTSKFLIILQEMNSESSFTPEQIKEITERHVEHVKDLDSKGILFLCGPIKGHEKGVFILNASSYEEAEGHVLRDPLIVNKGYKSYVIYEIIEANAGNNYLL